MLNEIGNADITLVSAIKRPQKISYPKTDFPLTSYKKNDILATRDAFGKAVVQLGKINKKVVCVDAELKDSTRSEFFFNAFPERSFEAFIAEQAMVGMAIGLSTQGFIPFTTTFAAFYTRAHDFIRMAAISKTNIKFVGSHAGVHIGQDGPSQMGLEDLSMFLSIPDALVLYPSDAVSTEYLLREMAKHQGISYLRTGREKTPILYDSKEKFPIGGFKVLKQSKKDKALVIGAGITVHEALKAYEILKKKGISIRVIDLYCIKPINLKALQKNAAECNNKVITAEDHYANGIGAAVASAIGKVIQLYVKEIPRSGKPDELLRKYGIDAHAIVKEMQS